MALRLTDAQIERMERYRLRPCDNCGRKHWGMYSVYRSYWEGDEVDFIWCTPDGMPRKCENGHDRDPCSPKECHTCWIQAIEEWRAGEAS